MQTVYSFFIALCLHLFLIISCTQLPAFPFTQRAPVTTRRIMWISCLQKEPIATAEPNVLEQAQALTENLLKAATRED